MSGRVPKWTKGTDCKSVIRGFESHLGLSIICPIGASGNAGGAVAGPKEEPKAPKPGWVFQNPPDLVTLDAGRRNPFFYVGETVSFTAKGPAADRFEVRDYWGEVVDQGAFAATITDKPQPRGWYRVFVFGKPVAEPKKDPRTPAEQELDGDVTPQTKAKA